MRIHHNNSELGFAHCADAFRAASCSIAEANEAFRKTGEVFRKNLPALRKSFKASFQTPKRVRLPKAWVVND